MSKFNPINPPFGWEESWTKYPHGYTIYEALLDWLKHVNDLTTDVNDWNVFLQGFIETFDVKLKDEVTQLVQTWIDSGYIEVVISEALQTEIDAVDLKLDQTISNFNDELNKSNQEIILRSPPQYGNLKLPSDFNDGGIKLHRGGNGLITHNVNIESFKTGLKTIYVSDTGNNTSGTGLIGAPYRTIHKALIDAIAAAESSVVILSSLTKSMRGEFADEGVSNYITFSNKRISIINTNSSICHVVEAQDSGRGTFATSGAQRQPALVWTLHSGGCYVTSRSSTGYVTDISNLERETNTVVKMELASSLNHCIATPNTYFISGSDVYVHTFNSRVPDASVELIINAGALRFNLLANAVLFIEGFYFHGESGLIVDGVLSSKFILNRCNIGRTRINNCLNINDVGTTYLFNCVGHDALKDIYNYHYYNTPSLSIRNVFVFEYYVTGFRAGLDDTLENNNVTTMHEGASILRVGTVGYNTRGTPCADINGSYSVLFDCHMSGSIANPLDNYSNAYYFYTDVDKSGMGAKAYMENCSAVGERQDILLDTGTQLTLKAYQNGLDRIAGNGVITIKR